MWVGSELNPLCASANEESDPLVNNAPLTGYDPKIFDDYHISETTEIFIQESPATPGPRTCMTRRSVTVTQEREDPASRRQADHSLAESLLSSQSFCRGHSFQTSEKISAAAQKMTNQDSAATTKRADSR